jgi:hypothetical protein
VVKDIEEAIADDEVPSSEYRPLPGANAHIIIRSSNNENPPNTPSRLSQPSNNSRSRLSTKSTAQTGERGRRKGAHSSTHRQRNLGRFYTPQCLIGII